MSTKTKSRRPARTGLSGVALLALAILPSSAAPLRQARVEIAAYGIGPNAALLRDVLTPRLAESLAASPGADFGPDSRLLVRITSVFISSNVPFGAGDRRHGLGESAFDSMEGDLLVVDRKGQVIRQERLLVHSNVLGAGAWYSPSFDRMRYIRLAETFAGWVPRKLRP